ncbi:hypothetical protein [Synechococcus sp. BA-132 BA5]|uniref:hypothetical protein n=1 Tax=Synechococcus sp. BA-132 BA5 TaxID=3110252 RepID=UPI002B1FCC98|nr:hypothetical protein [Synechococcus sp. BA-132 BA5]
MISPGSTVNSAGKPEAIHLKMIFQGLPMVFKSLWLTYGLDHAPVVASDVSDRLRQKPVVEALGVRL